MLDSATSPITEIVTSESSIQGACLIGKCAYKSQRLEFRESKKEERGRGRGDNKRQGTKNAETKEKVKRVMTKQNTYETICAVRPAYDRLLCPSYGPSYNGTFLCHCEW